MKNREIDAFLLAAGLGTRMGPLSKVLPKPAWTLRGKPLLLWGLEGLQEAGFTQVACNAHHLPHKIQALAEGRLEVFLEPLLLGSAGGLHHVVGRAVDPLAVWNGDAWSDVPWAAFMAEHRARRADLSWLLVPHHGGPWNPVWLNDNGHIVLQPSPQDPRHQHLQGPYHFTGASLWSHRALSLIPQGPADTKADILPRLHHHAGIVVPPFPWYDIGSPDQLISAAHHVAPQEEGRVMGCYLYPNAVDNGTFRRCVLGPGACPPSGTTDENALWFEEGLHQVRLRLD